jgi:hypothetical protein
MQLTVTTLLLPEYPLTPNQSLFLRAIQHGKRCVSSLWHYCPIRNLCPTNKLLSRVFVTTQRFGDWILSLSLSSCKTYSVGPNLRFGLEIRTSSIEWAQLSRFYLKTETEPSLRNVVFWNINRKVFLDKDRTMGNVQKHNICTTVWNNEYGQKFVLSAGIMNLTRWTEANGSCHTFCP